MKTLLPSLLALSFSLAACTAAPLCADDPSTCEDSVSTTEDDLRTVNIASIEASSHPGFMALGNGACAAGAGTWKVHFVSAKLEASLCDASGQPQKVSKVLSTSELDQVRAAVRRVRITNVPSACMVDGPENSLQVSRKSGAPAEKYIDEQVSCGASPYRPAANLGKVTKVLGAIAAPPTKICAGPNHLQCPTGETCLRTGAFPDAFGKCYVDSDPVCMGLATCDPNKSIEVSSCAKGATCNYFSFCGNEILCQDK